MANPNDLVQVISECIKNSETNKLASVFEDPANTSLMKSNCWDVLHVLCANLNTETYEKQPAIFQCCEKLVNKVAEVSCPEEALLELIEQAECPDNDDRFLVLLKPIHKLLMRMPDKRGRSLVWCLDLVTSHISSLPEPGSYRLEGAERALLDLDPATSRMVNIFDSITPFYEPFIHEVSLLKPHESADKPVIAQRQYQRHILVAFLVHLLGKPLVCMDLDFDGKTKSKIRRVAEKIVGFTNQVLADVMPILAQRCLGRKKDFDDNNWDVESSKIFLFEEKVPILGLSNLLYLVLAGGLPRQIIPQVYSPFFVFHVVLHLTVELLQMSHDVIAWKGLQLAEVLVRMLPQSSITLTMLDLPVHQKFCTNLEKVIVFCNIESCRIKGIKVLQNYVMIMDLSARYQVFIKLFPLLEHSGVKGIVVTMLKDTIISTMTDVQNPSIHRYRSKSLMKLVAVYCHVPNGPEIDLMDHSDHIISLLNMLWYIAMADKGDCLGLWEHAPYLDRNFINPLKDGLKLSRAHYELKIHQLEEERMAQSQEKQMRKEMEVSVTVHGESVPDLSYDEKKQILNVALNKFSIMESLLTSIREKVESRFAAKCIRSSWAAIRLYQSTDSSAGPEAPSASTVNNSNPNPDTKNIISRSPSTSEKDYDRDIAKQILAASLQFVPKSGWTKKALSEGAETLGYVGIAHGMFPLGGVELVNFFYADCNERLVERLKKESESRPEGKTSEPEVIVCDAVEARLRMIIPYLDRWSEAMVLLSLPRNVPNSLANLLTLVDDICFYAGDRSVDVRWYSRRLGLATVYKMTELYFIQDQSEDHKATWKFLQQRVEEAVQLQRILHEAGITPKIALDTISSTFDTARSILRLR